jgi:hypothetical protein
MSMSWFGKRYDAPYCECPQTETPVGVRCLYCAEAIDAGDDGLIYADGSVFHRECHVRLVVGSIGHQQQRCSCYGGDDDSEDGMTPRDGAKAALKYCFSKPTTTKMDHVNADGHNEPERYRGLFLG